MRTRRETRMRDGELVYCLDGEEVSHKAFHADWHVKPPDYSKGECPSVRPDMGDFSGERDKLTGRRGRYMPQLAKFRGDKSAVFEHVNDAVQVATDRGMNVEKT